MKCLKCKQERPLCRNLFCEECFKERVSKGFRVKDVHRRRCLLLLDSKYTVGICDFLLESNDVVRERVCGVLAFGAATDTAERCARKFGWRCWSLQTAVEDEVACVSVLNLDQRCRLKNSLRRRITYELAKQEGCDVVVALWDSQDEATLVITCLLDGEMVPSRVGYEDVDVVYGLKGVTDEDIEELVTVRERNDRSRRSADDRRPGATALKKANARADGCTRAGGCTPGSAFSDPGWAHRCERSVGSVTREYMHRVTGETPAAVSNVVSVARKVAAAPDSVCRLCCYLYNSGGDASSPPLCANCRLALGNANTANLIAWSTATVSKLLAGGATVHGS